MYFGTYTEYRVIEGIPEEGVMLEVVNVQHGVLHTRVNNILFENGRGFCYVSYNHYCFSTRCHSYWLVGKLSCDCPAR